MALILSLTAFYAASFLPQRLLITEEVSHYMTSMDSIS